MLRGVLRRFVPENDFIEFIKSKEEEAGEKLYSAGKQNIFGGSFPIKLEKGHVCQCGCDLKACKKRISSF